MKITIIIPYFGKLPNNIESFIISCKANPNINFYLFSDDSNFDSKFINENFHFIRMTFLELKKRINNKDLGNISYPYKLCDYKPLYGIIFSEYIKDSEYWGYCDIDTMLGDISGYLKRINYMDYVRIGSRGHFTLYKNDVHTNNLYKYHPQNTPPICNFNFVKNTTYPCHFDEIGMNIIVKELNLPFYENNHVAQTTIFHDLHLHTLKNHKIPELFVWEKGHTFVYTKVDSKKIDIVEYMYIHFQNRKDMPINESLEESILITHKGFYQFNKNDIEELFQRFGRADTEQEKIQFLESENKNKLSTKKARLFREIKTFGLKSLYNLYNRYISIIWLKKNNLFY